MVNSVRNLYLCRVLRKRTKPNRLVLKTLTIVQETCQTYKTYNKKSLLTYKIYNHPQLTLRLPKQK